jgi:hypothetical protein
MIPRTLQEAIDGLGHDQPTVAGWRARLDVDLRIIARVP